MTVESPGTDGTSVSALLRIIRHPKRSEKTNINSRGREERDVE